MSIKEQFGKHYPEPNQNSDDFLKEVTVGHGNHARRGFLVTGESRPATIFHGAGIGEKCRVVMVEQFSGFYSMVAVHINQIVDKLIK